MSFVYYKAALLSLKESDTKKASFQQHPGEIARTKRSISIHRENMLTFSIIILRNKKTKETFPPSFTENGITWQLGDQARDIAISVTILQVGTIVHQRTRDQETEREMKMKFLVNTGQLQGKLRENDDLNNLVKLVLKRMSYVDFYVFFVFMSFLF